MKNFTILLLLATPLQNVCDKCEIRPTSTFWCW